MNHRVPTEPVANLTPEMRRHMAKAVIDLCRDRGIILEVSNRQLSVRNLGADPTLGEHLTEYRPEIADELRERYRQNEIQSDGGLSGMIRRHYPNVETKYTEDRILMARIETLEGEPSNPWIPMTTLTVAEFADLRHYLKARTRERGN